MLYTMDQEIIYILPFGITSYTGGRGGIGNVASDSSRTVRWK